MTELTGLVLAGGASTRMGTDKALLEIDGERLVDRVVRRVSPCCVEVLVAPGSARPLTVAGARTISDAPGEGPLAAIVAGLGHAQTPLLAVVAVDMPRARADVLRAVAAAWEGEAAVVPVVEGELQPLHAVYAVSWVVHYARLLAGGERSARRAVGRLAARTAGADIWGAADRTGEFAVNVNTPQDLAALATASSRGGGRRRLA